MKNKIYMEKEMGKEKFITLGIDYSYLSRQTICLLKDLIQEMSQRMVKILVVLIEGDNSQLTVFIDFVNNQLNRPNEAIVDNVII